MIKSFQLRRINPGRIFGIPPMSRVVNVPGVESYELG